MVGRMRVIRLHVLGALALLAAWTARADATHDPMRPPSSGADAKVTRTEGVPLRLEAILRRGEARLAIVNGQIVHEGTRVANAVITRISEDLIQYSYAGHEHSATLPTPKLNVRAFKVTHEDRP